MCLLFWSVGSLLCFLSVSCFLPEFYLLVYSLFLFLLIWILGLYYLTWLHFITATRKSFLPITQCHKVWQNSLLIIRSPLVNHLRNTLEMLSSHTNKKRFFLPSALIEKWPKYLWLFVKLISEMFCVCCNFTHLFLKKWTVRTG